MLKNMSQNNDDTTIMFYVCFGDGCDTSARSLSASLARPLTFLKKATQIAPQAHNDCGEKNSSFRFVKQHADADDTVLGLFFLMRSQMKVDPIQPSLDHIAIISEVPRQ